MTKNSLGGKDKGHQSEDFAYPLVALYRSIGVSGRTGLLLVPLQQAFREEREIVVLYL